MMTDTAAPSPKRYEIITTALTVLPTGDALYSEYATTVELDDEAAGKFVTVTQESGKVAITKEEWPALKDAIDRMIERCAP
jgi:hypothetical protein